MSRTQMQERPALKFRVLRRPCGAWPHACVLRRSLKGSGLQEVPLPSLTVLPLTPADPASSPPPSRNHLCLLTLQQGQRVHMYVDAHVSLSAGSLLGASFAGSHLAHRCTGWSWRPYSVSPELWLEDSPSQTLSSSSLPTPEGPGCVASCSKNSGSTPEVSFPGGFPEGLLCCAESSQLHLADPSLLEAGPPSPAQ